MRFLRVALALFLFYNAYVTHEWFFIVFGILLILYLLFIRPSENKIITDLS